MHDISPVVKCALSMRRLSRGVSSAAARAGAGAGGNDGRAAAAAIRILQGRYNQP